MARKIHWHAATNVKQDFSTWMPMVFNSPYNDQDYQNLEDIWAHTIAGKCIDAMVETTIAEGINPNVEPLDKKVSQDERANIVSKYENEVNELKKIDDRFKMNDHIDDAIRNMWVFGRSAIAFEPNYQEIRAFKPIHPRDLGRVFIHQLDWSLSSVQAFRRTQNIQAEDMIYFCNFQNSPRYKTMHYGFSELERVIGQARALRRATEFDIVEIMETMWAGYGLIVVDNEGLTENDKRTDLATIKQGLKAGGFNLINGKKDEINYFPMNTDPKVSEISELWNKIERSIIGNFGIPGAILGREEDANMATLIGKIRFFVNAVIRPKRKQIEKVLTYQWYDKNMMILNKTYSEEVRLVVEYEPIIIEDWVDMLDAVQKLKNMFPNLPEDEMLKILHLEHLMGQLKPNNVMTPENLTEIAKNIDDVETKNKLMQQAALLSDKKK